MIYRDTSQNALNLELQKKPNEVSIADGKSESESSREKNNERVLRFDSVIKKNQSNNIRIFGNTKSTSLFKVKYSNFCKILDLEKSTGSN